MPKTAGARRRRSPAEVHQLILDAATALFAEQGYAATSTREIAARAGVVEALVYRHFGTKDALFREAVFAPLRAFFSEYTSTWRARLATGEPAPGSSGYMGGLYDVLRANRELLLTLLASDLHRDAPPDAADSERSPLLELLDEVEELVALEQKRSLRPSLDPGLAVRMTFAMALSMALFGDLMFPSGPGQPSRDQLVTAMGEFLTRATARPERG